MKLYWCPRTRSFRALWMLEEAGVPYERQLIDIRKGDQNAPAYRAVNPMGKVPALVEGPARIFESAAICAYVAERALDARLAPPMGDPRRGRYLTWLFFAAACMEDAFVEKIQGKGPFAPERAGWGSFERVMETLAGALGKGPWLLGEQFTAADVMVGANLLFGREILKILPDEEPFAGYVARCRARPGYRRAEEIEAAGI
ncbi:MAG: glutathione S-transferase [Alphaproteobacteria bacterium]|nr:glutathione S-transferase [Alphaproteobacteria bacterium]